MDTIYIEHAVADHPRSHEICGRFPAAQVVPIEHYKNVFNASAQDFRLQKRSPKLILARQDGQRVLPTPPGYHIGGQYNYYFAHMLNCVYDCRYCFLQGMYASANMVVFVNLEDFFSDIAALTDSHQEPSWFFSGYDCDSLAMDPITGFTDVCLDHFLASDKACLELRTKSTQIRPLLKRSARQNVVVAYSLSPEPIIEAEEHGTPSLNKRLQALVSLQEAGWPIGLRFDPLLYADNFEELYGAFFEQVFRTLNMSQVHSISLGSFRLPIGFHKRMVRLYPDARLLAAPLVRREKMMTYSQKDEEHMHHFCLQHLSAVVSDEQIFPCS